MIPENRQRDAFTETYVNWVMVKDYNESIDKSLEAIKNSSQRIIFLTYFFS